MLVTPFSPLHNLGKLYRTSAVVSGRAPLSKINSKFPIGQSEHVIYPSYDITIDCKCLDQRCRCAYLLPLGILIQGLPVPHSGNDLMRSMEDSQQKIATIVYRAGTKDGPSFDSDENINEGNFHLSIHLSCIILSSSTYQII